jgi:glycosyltransferase involved in cell wall biosynthesis
VDLAAFDPGKIAPARTEALKTSWGVAPNRRIVLQAARLTGWKGQRVTIAAVAALARRGKLGDVTVVLAGDAQGRDGYLDTLRRDIAAGGLDGIVILPGHVSDMAAAFAAAQVTVIASTEAEAFGRTATEAQAMGCPVIATDLGAPRETVVTEPPGAATGWLVQPGDASGLATRLEAALTLAPPQRAGMGASARANVAARFTVAAMQQKTLSVYDHLLSANLADRFSVATD